MPEKRRSLIDQLAAAKQRISELEQAELAQFYLSALVGSADDAIISKTLNGIVTSWNQGAEKIFGYRADEMIGQPVTKLIPPDHPNEEPRILERLRRGERIEHYETQRLRKDGRLINVSVTVSPVGDHTAASSARRRSLCM